jgi:Ca2+-binding RTX toxin-like protein
VYVRLALGDGDDLLTLAGVGVDADGGPGADELTGGDSDDSLSGGGGDDALHGGRGADPLSDGDPTRPPARTCSTAGRAATRSPTSPAPRR